MKRYFYIGLGGIFGSLARFLLSSIIAQWTTMSFPINTFLINVSGCLLLGFFLTAALEFIEINPNLRLSISTGFIGSYTTFSTFTNELNMLLISQNYLIVILYFLISFLFGVFSIWLGTITARKYFCRIKFVESEEQS